tara:strand:- start:1149 stop:2171 length:1023 start_codon:yes stop_codon:yes gene_type:complete
MKKKTAYAVAVVGATGAVGKEMISILEERRFPVDTLQLFASSRSAGTNVSFNGQSMTVMALEENSFAGVDIALFSAGASVSREYASSAVNAGAVVIDNSSAFRMDPDIPLVVPEVNPGHLSRHHGIIANPNCSTIQMVCVLKPLHDVARIKRVVVTTFQSVSGTGSDAMAELLEQCQHLLAFQEVKPIVYPHQIAFNVIPHIEDFLPDGYSKEEMKLVNETKKIMGDDSIRIAATAARVPVYVGHAESVNVETDLKMTPEVVRSTLSEFPGIQVFDDPQRKVYPMPLHVAGTDNVFVGRIREDPSIENGFHLWVVADNLRKGAALNAVQIAEKLIDIPES